MAAALARILPLMIWPYGWFFGGPGEGLDEPLFSLAAFWLVFWAGIA